MVLPAEPCGSISLVASEREIGTARKHIEVVGSPQNQAGCAREGAPQTLPFARPLVDRSLASLGVHRMVHANAEYVNATAIGPGDGPRSAGKNPPERWPWGFIVLIETSQ